ncbi:hypothetical protein [Flavobacterium daejeonense]|uniref:hypothetical protein n=1 Tax=Flavobacterium daejeonense TaxID=350893 RepID=UPI000478BD01|nr:hypothetical protein [Flavobacterium daejeonense]
MNNYKETYIITIAEPWDFESPDGKNIIRGTILSIIDSVFLIFKTNYILNFGGISGDILILSPRFKDDNFNNVTSKKISVNGGLFLNDYNTGLEERKLKDNSKFVLIGTLNKQKDKD